MKNAISLTGHVLVCDILAGLEPMVPEDVLSGLDSALEERRDERIAFEDTEVLIEEAADALPEPEGPDFDQSDVIDLAEAIRIGEREQAELLLDRLFANLPDAPTLGEWIDRGRYSKKAREAKAAGKTPELKAVA